MKKKEDTMKKTSGAWVATAIVLLIIGFIICVVGGIFAIAMSNEKTIDFVKEYTDEKITALDMELQATELIIEEGDTFSINAENVEENFETTIEDGVWTIRSEGKKNAFFKEINIVGYKRKTGKIVITIPKGHTLETATFEFGAGSFKIDDLTCTKRLDLSLGVGEVDLNNIKANEISLSNAVGVLRGDGILTKRLEVENGIGYSNIRLEKESDFFGYEIEGGIGHIKIGEEIDSSGIALEKSMHLDREGLIKVECGIGEVVVRFK